MEIYWFGRHLDRDLSEVSDLLEDSGFYGWLLPYEPGLPDPFVRIARSLNTDQKLKYLVSVRPHTITPQYLLAITQSLDLIQEDRVRIDFVPGLTDVRNESFGGILGEVKDNSSFEDRKKYLCSYIKEFKNLKAKKPYTYISGMVDDLCPHMLDFSDANIVAYHRLTEGKLEGYSKDTIIFFTVTDIKTFHERIDYIKSAGYNKIMLQTPFSGHPSIPYSQIEADADFDLAKLVFKEVAHMI